MTIRSRATTLALLERMAARDRLLIADQFGRAAADAFPLCDDSAMKELPPYPDTTILVVEVGSTAHGTGLAGGEDHDETVIWLETPADVFAIRDTEPRPVQVRTQAEGVPSGPGDTDRTLYSLRRFLSLATAGNPTILLVLWAPIIGTTHIGDDLRARGSMFVGRHLVPRYRGYMQAQVDRLMGRRGGRHGKLRHDPTGIGFDTKYAMHAARLGYQGIELLTTGRLELPIGGEAGDWLRAVRAGRVPLSEWAERTRELDARLAALADDASIPRSADRNGIVRWSAEVHRATWDDPRSDRFRSPPLPNG